MLNLSSIPHLPLKKHLNLWQPSHPRVHLDTDVFVVALIHCKDLCCRGSERLRVLPSLRSIFRFRIFEFSGLALRALIPINCTMVFISQILIIHIFPLWETCLYTKGVEVGDLM
jgi:hypothetical protein